MKKKKGGRRERERRGVKAERPSSRGRRGTTYTGTGTWFHLVGASGGDRGVQTGEDQDIKLRNTNVDQTGERNC